jgi:hypothetical protein
MDEPNELLENAIAQLQLIANNGGIASFDDAEAKALADELERLSGFERAYHREIDAYDKLVSGVDLDLDEQADLIADLLEQLKQTEDALAYWFPRWGDLGGADSQMMVNVRAEIDKAERYLEHYKEHVKGVITHAN